MGYCPSLFSLDSRSYHNAEGYFRYIPAYALATPFPFLSAIYIASVSFIHGLVCEADLAVYWPSYLYPLTADCYISIL